MQTLQKIPGRGLVSETIRDGFCIDTVRHPNPGLFIMEAWKEIPGYEGIYQASTFGRIKRCHRIIKMKNGRKKTLYEKIIKSSLINSGYLTLNLSKNGKSKHFLVHKLIAITFILKPEKKDYNNHKDGNKLNNHFANLEWCTQKENMQHAVRTGLWKYPGKTKAGIKSLSENAKKRFKGIPKTKEHNEKNRQAQLGKLHPYQYKKVRCINNDKVYESIKECIEELGISRNAFEWRIKHKMKDEYQFEYAD